MSNSIPLSDNRQQDNPLSDQIHQLMDYGWWSREIITYEVYDLRGYLMATGEDEEGAWRDAIDQKAIDDHEAEMKAARARLAKWNSAVAGKGVQS